jgi:hypothetical protein
LNNNKIARVLYKILLIMLIVLFSICFISSIFNIGGGIRDFKMGNYVVIIMGVILYIKGAFRLNAILYTCTEKQLKIISILTFVAMVIGFIIVGYNLRATPTSDLVHLHYEAIAMLENNRVSSIYFNRFLQNEGLTIMLYFLYRLSRFFGFVNYRAVGIMLNIFMISITALLGSKIIQIIKNNRLATLFIILFALQPVIYLYVPYYYTDTVSMPFALGAILLFYKGEKAQNKSMSFINYAMTGILIFLGIQIRATTIILAVAFIMGWFLKYKWKRILSSSVMLLLGIIICSFLYSFITFNYGIERNKDLNFPPVHYITMGLFEPNGGGWNSDDFNRTNNLETYDKKVEGNLEQIKSRLSKMGLKGTISHIIVKIEKVWTLGDSDARGKLNTSEKYGSLYEYLAGDKSVFIDYFCQIVRGGLFLLLIIYCFIEYRKKDIGNASIIMIALFGAFLFYILWEAMYRYSLNFIPWMLLIAAFSVDEISILEKVKKIELYFEDEKIKIWTDNHFNKYKKLLAIIIIISSCIVGGVNRKPLIMIKALRIDQRVRQTSYNIGETIREIDNGSAVQTFHADMIFNSISLKLYNENKVIGSEYVFRLYDKNDNIIVEQKFSTDDVKHSTNMKFNFENIIPSSLELYKLSIEKVKGEGSIGIYRCQYFHNGYIIQDRYEMGELTYNGVNYGDMQFLVTYETERPMVSARVFYGVWITAILIELWAFYPELSDCLKIKRKSKIMYKKK